METLHILAQQQKGGGLFQLVFLVLMFVVMWVILIRPQQKRQKELKAKQASLKKGDKIITIGGIHGTVNAVSPGSISLRVAENVFMKIDKSAVATIENEKADAGTEA